MEKNNLCSPPKSHEEVTTVAAETSEALVDDLADTKLQLVKLGRRVFQLSSRVASVRHEDEIFFDDIPSDHAFFGNENLTEMQLNEFYKASEGFVAFLKNINFTYLVSS